MLLHSMSDRQPADADEEAEVEKAGQSADAALAGESAEAETAGESTVGAPPGGSDEEATAELYVVYWVDEKGYGGSCEFVHAPTLERAREQSSYASGGVAHQRLLFEGSFEAFREYVETELEDADRFELVWD